MNKDYIAHASTDARNEIVTHLFPLGNEGILFFSKRIFLSFPIYAWFGLAAVFYWIWVTPGFPIYLFFLALFGYHFFFPYPLKQYHGAEHKVFSHQGVKSLDVLNDVSHSDIVNRHCSTNSVVTFYMLFLLFLLPLGANLASLLGLFGVVIIPRWLSRLEEIVVFPISAFLQRKITTVEPHELHLKVALLSYISLIQERAVNEPLLTKEFLLARQQQEQAEQLRLQNLAKAERLRVIEETEWVEI